MSDRRAPAAVTLCVLASGCITYHAVTEKPSRRDAINTVLIGNIGGGIALGTLAMVKDPGDLSTGERIAFVVVGGPVIATLLDAAFAASSRIFGAFIPD